MSSTDVRQQAGARLLWAELSGGLRRRTHERRAILRLLPATGLTLVTTAIVVQLIAGVMPVLFILATAHVIGGVPAAVAAGAGSSAWADLRDRLIAAAVTFLAIQVLLPVQDYLGERIRRRVDNVVRDRLMVASFAAEGTAVLQTKEVADQASEGVNALRYFQNTPGAACAGLIALVSRYLQTVLAAALIGFVFSWPAAAAVLAAALLIRVGYRVGLSLFGRIFLSVRPHRLRAWYFRDLMVRAEPAKEVRLFGLLGWVGDRYAAAMMDAARPVWRVRRSIFYGPFVLYTLVALVLIGVSLAFATRSAATGVIGIGSFMIAVQGTLSAVRIGGFIAESDVQTEYGMLAHRAVTRFEALAEGMERRTGQGAFDHVEADLTGRPVREIRFDKVSFRYADDQPLVLDELDLTIAAGLSLAIVGLNGAGKTTLVKLLARLHEPTSGAILVDGLDIRTFPIDQWQRKVAAIFQDFIKFELPLRDNVGFGAVQLLDDADEADRAIRAALGRAGALDLADELPHGLNTVLSRRYTNGTDLSSGQWQRIAIARALVAVQAGATVLVLDEPTASLDVRSEVRFFEEFLELTRDVTSIVISHRFSTVRRADRIVVIEHGSVTEMGSHDELVSAGGRYAELFQLQAARFTDEGESDMPPGAGMDRA